MFYPIDGRQCTEWFFDDQHMFSHFKKLVKIDLRNEKIRLCQKS